MIDRDIKKCLGQMTKGVQVEEGQYFSYPGHRFGHLKARTPGESVRDRLLDRLADADE